MTAIAMDISEAASKFTELVTGLKRNQEIVITADNLPVARLTSIPPNSKRRHAGTAEGQFWMSPDFNEPLDEFKEYME